jgi:hypothetical protein
MILLLDGDSIIESIGAFIGIIILFYLLSIVGGYYMGALSRLSGRNIRVNGKLAATPDTINEMNDQFKDNFKRASQIVTALGNYTGKKFDAFKRTQIEHVIVDNRRDKVAKLHDLAILKANGTINEKEFELIKQEIFNSCDDRKDNAQIVRKDDLSL